MRGDHPPRVRNFNTQGNERKETLAPIAKQKQKGACRLGIGNQTGETIDKGEKAKLEVIVVVSVLAGAVGV